MSRKFFRGKNDKYSLVENDELGKLCKKYKDEYDAKVDEYKKQVNWNNKMKKHTKILPREGYLARAVREYYPDLQGLILHSCESCKIRKTLLRSGSRRQKRS